MLPVEPASTKRCHQLPSAAGARVPVKIAFNGLPTFPIAVRTASQSACPPIVWSAAGSSMIASGTPTKPRLVLGLEPTAFNLRARLAL